MKTRRAITLLSAFALLANCAPQPKAQIETLRPPHSFLQLVEAVWNVNGSGLILADEFYSVDNLKRAFGGTDVTLEVGKFDVLIGTCTGEISGFPAWMPAAKGEGAPLRFRKMTMSPDGERRGLILLGVSMPTGVYLKAIEERFGKSWTEPPPVVPPHPITRDPATHRDGYRTIVYSSGDERAGRRASFSFGRDGTLQSMSVSSNGPKNSP
jgi:hypothetical protein